MARERTVRLLADGVGGERRNVGFCRGCGLKILWARTALNKKPIPFDDLELSGILSDDGEIETVDAATVHWGTCSAKDQFRR